MNKEINIDDIRLRFKYKPTVTKEDIFNYFIKFKTDLTESNLRMLIHQLRNNKIIIDVKKGVYSFGIRPQYLPVIDKRISKLGQETLNKKYAGNYLIWDSLWLNEFTTHQTTSSLVIIECEKDYLESIYYLLKDNNLSNVYIQPNKHIIDTYISENKNSIIVRQTISRSPFNTVAGLRIPSIEKMLIDLFADKDMFFAFQGQELKNIYYNSISRYQINYSKMFTYAKRRNRYHQLISFLNESKIFKEDFLNGIIKNDR